jgi:hypothetical protein
VPSARPRVPHDLRDLLVGDVAEAGDLDDRHLPGQAGKHGLRRDHRPAHRRPPVDAVAPDPIDPDIRPFRTGEQRVDESVVPVAGAEPVDPPDHVTGHHPGQRRRTADHHALHGDRAALLIKLHPQAGPARAAVAVTHGLDRREIAGIGIEMRQHLVHQRLGDIDLPSLPHGGRGVVGGGHRAGDGAAPVRRAIGRQGNVEDRAPPAQQSQLLVLGRRHQVGVDRGQTAQAPDREGPRRNRLQRSGHHEVDRLDLHIRQQSRIKSGPARSLGMRGR